MSIENLQISNFRNIANINISPSPVLNIIYGENASGKSSFLEAIHILLTSKSFRTTKADVVIKSGHEKLQVLSKLYLANESKRLGIEKNKTKTRIRFSGDTIRSAAKLAMIQPITLLTPECHQLILGPASKRRSFLDWLLFHVEQSYYDCWNTYNKVLKHRNALLRKKSSYEGFDVWDDKLVESAIVLDQKRKKISGFIIEELNNKINTYCDFPIEISYENGWGDAHFSDVIKNSRAKDIAVGYTRKGPHRANLSIRSNQQLAINVLSRGQTKLLSAALEISKVSILKDMTGKSSIILVDDLAAELDSERKDIIIDMLSALSMQLFITTTDTDQLPKDFLKKSKMFHVKHGSIQEVVY